jgi:filamentous hemagglutinin family protein
MRLNQALALLLLICPSASAQLITPAIDGTQTQVNSQGDRFDIRGGTRTGNNLFHSFERFNLNANQTANFLSNPTIQTILGRIVGGDLSKIDGLIQVTGGPSNLFLINPAGIIFGSSAQLNVPASFTATTANAVQLNGQTWFDAIGTNDYASLVGSPSQLAFLTRDPGWIINAGNLGVPNGSSISLIGGIVINAGTLTAPDGMITIAALFGNTAVQIRETGSVLTLEVPLTRTRALSIPKLLTGGELESATGVQLEDGVIRLTRSAIPAVPGSAIAEGTLSANFIETSGTTNLEVSGANISAKTWLLDPSNINIINGGTGTPTAGIFDPTTATATISPITIQNALNSGTNVIITTTSGIGATGGDITLSSPINQTLGGTASLTLTGRRFLLPGSATINLTSTGGLIFNLNKVAPEATPPASSIQNALDAIGNVNGNRTINLTGGTYSTNTPISWTKSATINGEIGANTRITGNDATRIFEIDPGVNAQIRDVAITNGRVGPGQSGGAIENLGNLTLINSTVSNSQAGLDGGGISTFSAGATLTVINSTIENNRAQYGGGLSSTNDTVTTITGTRIRNNIATEAGGGIENTDGATLLIDNSEIRQNTARYGGGLTLFRNQNVVIQQTTIADNIAQDYGGAIASNQDASVSLQGVTIARNRATTNAGGGIHNASAMQLQSTVLNDNQAGRMGGGIENTNTGTLIIRDSNLSRNSVPRLGGGIHSQGRLDIFTTTFADNIAQGDPNPSNSGGGAIYNSGNNGILTITNSRLLNNRAVYGGAIDNTFSNSITINDSLIANNTAVNEGGAILTDVTTRLEINNSQIFGNRALAGDAGGIYVSFNTTIQNSTISDNFSGAQGGGIYSISNLNLLNTTISNNTASQGGGIFSRAAVSVSNSTISGNRATDGAGLFVETGTVTLSSSTIANNQATNLASGIFNVAGIVNLENTIVANNQNDVRGNFSDRGNNLIGNSTNSTGFTLSTLVGTTANPLDPQLAPLANNGGSTATHALLSTSPAIDVGNNAVATASDQRGAPRIQGSTIDIGAYESSVLPPQPPELPESPELPELPEPLEPPNFSLPPVLPPAIAPTPIAPELPNLEKPLQPLIDRNTESRQALTSISDLDRSLTQDYVKHYGLKTPAPVDLQDIQKMLAQLDGQTKTRSAVVYAVFVPNAITPAPKVGDPLPKSIDPITPFLRSRLKRADDRLDLILITSTGRAIRFSTPTTRAQVTQQAGLFRLAISDEEDDKGYVALSKRLYSWLAEPLEAELKRAKITSLIYCLDEGLRTIPIAAMSDNAGFIVDRYTVSIIPSIALLNRDRTNLAPLSVLAMGADTFQNLEPLPSVPTELKFISENFWKGTRFLNQDFTLKRLQERTKLDNLGILHLATHASFNAGAPSQSYIQFWDTPLRLNQVNLLAPVPLTLLVLSACETALGSSEAELGFAGIAAASGIHSVVGSLWTISDLGTLALMSEFYVQLRQAPTRAEALKRAQSALLKGQARIENGTLITSQNTVPLPPSIIPSDRALDLTHPFYWSSFTLVGNPW